MLNDVLAPLPRRTPDELRDRLWTGSAEHCAEVFPGYAQAACEWVQIWPLGEERRQAELFAERVRPKIESTPLWA